MDAPLVNDYKKPFIIRRLLQTFLGGLRLYFPTSAPLYIYFLQVTLFAFIPASCAAFIYLFNLDFAHASVINGCIILLYGIFIHVLALCLQKNASRKTEPDQVHSIGDEEEILFDSIFGFKTWIFLIPPKKTNINIFLHSSVAGLVGGLTVYYLHSQSSQNLFYNFDMRHTFNFFALVTSSIGIWPLIVGSPPEPATFFQLPFDLQALSRPSHLLTCFAVHAAASYNPEVVWLYYANCVAHVIFALCPLLWLIGALPPIDSYVLWAMERWLVIVLGLQHETIGASHPYGLPLGIKLLPQYLNPLGYVPRHVGKWHIGSFKKDYTPTYRGFDSHYGYWTGRIDYYDHTAYENPGWWGYDFRRNMGVDREAYGKYTTDLLTNEAVNLIQNHNSSKPLFLYLAHLAVHSGNPYDPLQAPADVIEKFSYIEDINRRKFAAMLWKLDEGIGEVIKALQDNNMLENSLIVFTTDNGGPAGGFNLNAASNWPLRGVKASMWEGGVRGAGLVWSPQIKNPGRVSKEMMQIVDWLPTLYTAAGGKSSELTSLDGIDVWNSIVNEEPSPRTQMLHNIDPKFNGAALRVGDWKLVYNASQYGPTWDNWFGPSGRSTEYSGFDSRAERTLIKQSLAGKAIKKLMPSVYKNIKSLKKSAQVLCGPIPKNATQQCSSLVNPCLFHIPSDPCEYFDVSYLNPKKVKTIKEMLAIYNSTAVPPGNKPFDVRANPKFWDYTWTNWQDYPPIPRFTSMRQSLYI